MTIKLGTHTSYDKKMTPIYFKVMGQRSKINPFYIANYKVISLFKSPVGRILQPWRCFGIFLNLVLVWPSTFSLIYVILCRGSCPYFRSGFTQPGIGDSLMH